MPLPFLAIALAVADTGAWHTYHASGTDVSFQLPGKVSAYAAPPSLPGERLVRFRSSYLGRTYTVVIGDVGVRDAPTYQKLWAEQRFGRTVKALLDEAVAGARDEKGSKLAMCRFGERNGFPSEVAALEKPDGSGSLICLFFTKKGIVYAGVAGDRSEASTKEAMRLAGSIDLSARK